MTAKIIKVIGHSFKGVVNYNLKHASLLLDIRNLPKQDVILFCHTLEFIAEQNSRTKNPVFHACLSFPPGEVLSDELYKAIAADYMEQMGYDVQPYGVWLHTDRAHLHLHIVSTRINAETYEKISDSKEYERSNEIRKKIEQKYRLQQAEKSSQYQSYTLKLSEAVAQAMAQRPRSIAQLTKLLAESKVEVKEAINRKTGKRQGYVFRFSDSTKTKAIASSKLPCFAEVSLIKQIVANKAAHKAAQAYVRKVLNFALKTAKNSDELTAALAKKSIATQLHRNARGIYGISFTYKETTLKGSEVGKPFTWERISAALEQNQGGSSGGIAHSPTIVPAATPVNLGGTRKKKKKDEDDEDDEDDVTGVRKRKISR